VQVLLYRAENNAALWGWNIVEAAAREVLVLEPGNKDALAFLEMAAIQAAGPPLAHEEVRAALLNRGSPRDERIWVIHNFSHFGASWSERAAFKQDLLLAGFGTGGGQAEIASEQEVTSDRRWHHWAITAVNPSSDVTDRVDALAGALAARNRIRYDGWSRLQRGDGVFVS
jgi:hypothetical protein